MESTYELTTQAQISEHPSFFLPTHFIQLQHIFKNTRKTSVNSSKKIINKHTTNNDYVSQPGDQYGRMVICFVSHRTAKR